MLFNPTTFKNEVLVGDGFYEFFSDIDKLKIKLPEGPEPVGYEIDIERINNDAKITRSEEEKDRYDLDIKNGCLLTNHENILISAYDEAINRYSAIEGKATYVSHSLIYLYEGKYYPLNKLTTLFVTKSEEISKTMTNAVFADKWDIDTTTNVKVSEQKRDFITKYSCDNSLLLIDGPFLAGDGMAVFRGIIKERFIDHGIVPIFVVKNSSAELVVESISALKGKFNSDLHWSKTILEEGQRTCFYRYTDKKIPDNTKMFCYMKFSKNASPIRIEIPTAIYYKYQPSINSYLDVIYYTLIEQGNFYNPQPRPIAIAEMFARETLNLYDFNKEMKLSNFTPTMNQNRGMEYDG